MCAYLQSLASHHLYVAIIWQKYTYFIYLKLNRKSTQYAERIEIQIPTVPRFHQTRL